MLGEGARALQGCRCIATTRAGRPSSQSQLRSSEDELKSCSLFAQVVEIDVELNRKASGSRHACSMDRPVGILQLQDADDRGQHANPLSSVQADET
jgi:hypothetical protein